MRKSAQQALVEALEGIRDELKGLRVAFIEREADIDRRLRVVTDEGARHERQIIDLRKRVGAG